jgi:hypothetical protein
MWFSFSVAYTQFSYAENKKINIIQKTEDLTEKQGTPFWLSTVSQKKKAKIESSLNDIDYLTGITSRGAT